MSERLKAHGGHLSIRSRPVDDPDHGTTVCATVPFARLNGNAITTEQGQQE
jgi:signal transduction histidine kinase